MRELDQIDYHRHLAGLTGPALVVFTAPFCGACRLLVTLLGRLEDRDEPRLPPVLRVDASQNRGLVEDLEVVTLPSLFLYRDGEFHAPLEAVLREEDLLGAIERTLAAPPEPEP